MINAYMIMPTLQCVLKMCRKVSDIEYNNLTNYKTCQDCRSVDKATWLADCSHNEMYLAIDDCITITTLKKQLQYFRIVCHKTVV